MKRNPNTTCSMCGKPIYRKPSELSKIVHAVYCSRKCRYPQHKTQTCPVCEKVFRTEGKKRIACSKSCANSLRKGSKYAKFIRGNVARRRVDFLRDTFGDNFQHCMVFGCCYNRTYAVHRLVEGKDGGKYEIGNMFAICPNHHQEIHSKIILVEKVNNYTLRITKDNFRKG